LSTSRAIRAVTEKLQNLLVKVDSNSKSKPLDAAVRDKVSLNIFLYQVLANPAWRNQDLPSGKPNGQPSRPLLPLNLYFVISACEDDQLAAHEKLGKVMLAIHDNPAILDFDAVTGIKNQPDPIRATLQPVSLDEMSKLWSAFQAPYRPSVAYEVGVVLIESEKPDSSPMPVTRRGDRGTGWDASTQFPPVLANAKYTTKNQYGARLGELVTLTGINLSAFRKPEIVFQHPQRALILKEPFRESPVSISDDEVVVQIPNAPDTWPAGEYLVRIEDHPPDGVPIGALPTGDVPVKILPEIVIPVDGLKVAQGTGNKRSLAVPCRPKLINETIGTRLVTQRVQILIGSVVIDDVDLSNPKMPVGKWNKNEVTFPNGEKLYVRLRVDGVESLVFDPNNLNEGFNDKLIVGNIP